MKTQSLMVAVIDNDDEDPRITSKVRKGQDPCKVPPYKKRRNQIEAGSHVAIPVPNPEGEDIIGKVERILPGRETQALVTFIQIMPYASVYPHAVITAETPVNVRFTITKWIVLRLLRYVPEE